MVAKRLSAIADKQLIGEVKRIFDIGSWHLGQSIEFAEIFPNARIDAFEPVPDSYALCLERLAALDQNIQERINIHNVALSNEKGDLPFYPVDAGLSSTPNIGASSMYKFKDGLNGTPFGQVLVQKEILVKSTTLDDWCIENSVDEVDILWMDVQGAEALVLKGGETILNRVRIIMTEVGLKPYYEGQSLKSDVDEILLKYGFKELDDAFELNGFDYEANAIYVKS